MLGADESIGQSVRVESVFFAYDNSVVFRLCIRLMGYTSSSRYQSVHIPFNASLSVKRQIHEQS